MRLAKKKRVETALYGLIGYPLEHSFSKKYFTEKFQREGINAEYENFVLPQIDQLPALLDAHPNLVGFNVTLPHKQAVIAYLQRIDSIAKLVGSVNTVKIDYCCRERRLTGYNTDVIGFAKTLDEMIGETKGHMALILGNGGSAKAVKYVLRERGIFFKSVSTQKKKYDQLTYDMLNRKIIESFSIIINTSPVGMFPNVDEAPDIPYQYLTASHYLIDLIYNPDETLFLRRGRERGAKTKNGLMMLYTQAEASWKIWQYGCR